MSAYARHQFALDRRVDGKSQRDHLRIAANAGRREAIERLRGPALPPECVLAWVVFADLDRWRGGGGMSVAPLTLHDVAAYEARCGTLDLETVELVKVCDAERLLSTIDKKEGKP